MASGNGDAIAVLRERVERLACDFPIRDNYFAWQAFGRGYDLESREAVPDYLKAENYAALKARIRSVSACSTLRCWISSRRSRPSRSTAIVLLDAQDWMNAGPAGRAVAEIDRTAAFARCQGDIPHRGRRESPCRRNCRPIFWRPGSIMNGRAGCCMPRTAPPSMAVSISMPAAPSPEDSCRADGPGLSAPAPYL